MLKVPDILRDLPAKRGLRRSAPAKRALRRSAPRRQRKHRPVPLAARLAAMSVNGVGSAHRVQGPLRELDLAGLGRGQLGAASRASSDQLCIGTSGISTETETGRERRSE